MSDGYTDLSLPTPSVVIPPGTWTLQGSRKRKQGKTEETYLQAVHGTGKGRKVATLGWMSEEVATRAPANLRALGGRLALSEPEVIKRVALSGGEIDVDVVKVIEDAEAQAKIDARDYASMTLAEYHEHVWWPHRVLTVEDSTIDRETKLWIDILRVLGHVRITRLDKHGWTTFLAGMENWGPTSKRLAQVAYRASLTYACDDLEAIPSVHRFDKIKGASKPTLPPGEALPADEVGALIDACSDQMYRALIAITFNKGLRPSEPTGICSRGRSAARSEREHVIHFARAGRTATAQLQRIASCGLDVNGDVIAGTAPPMTDVPIWGTAPVYPLVFGYRTSTTDTTTRTAGIGVGGRLCLDVDGTISG